MDWATWLMQIGTLVVGGSIGFASARFSEHLARLRTRREAEASWSVTALPNRLGVAPEAPWRYLVKNTGTQTARDVSFQARGCTVNIDRDHRDDFLVGEEEILLVTRGPDPSEILRISWTSHRGKRMQTSRALLRPDDPTA